MMEKVDPYLRPLFDALYDMLDAERVNSYLEQGVIEVAPLAFMRGRTLNDAFIILDEAQNTTPEQMKMFLTRLGFNSKMVVTGDITQIDLPGDQRSGLVAVRDILHEVHDIGFVHFGGEDVVRHKLVQRIVNAYADHAQAAAPDLRARRKPPAASSAMLELECPPELRAAAAGGAGGVRAARRAPDRRARRRGADPRAEPRASRDRHAHRRAVVPGRRRAARRRARASSATS